MDVASFSCRRLRDLDQLMLMIRVELIQGHDGTPACKREHTRSRSRRSLREGRKR
jgi:hypothetical protein